MFHTTAYLFKPNTQSVFWQQHSVMLFATINFNYNNYWLVGKVNNLMFKWGWRGCWGSFFAFRHLYLQCQETLCKEYTCKEYTCTTVMSSGNYHWRWNCDFSFFSPICFYDKHPVLEFTILLNRKGNVNWIRVWDKSVRKIGKCLQTWAPKVKLQFSYLTTQSAPVAHWHGLFFWPIYF